MAVWETEDESTGPVGSLPTPADTPYRTPSRNVSRGSRKSRRSVTPPGKNGKSSSPPPLPSNRSDRGSKRSSRDVTNDETISILDPRRFTPTLHANLVSEILNLKRDQEEKIKIIENLEVSLHSSREETESLQATLLTTGKESRSLKRQLALLEGGTSSALGELARERDEAVETAAETRKRLETAQKKVKSQEEDSERVHRQWAKEKDEWEEEKRRFERRVHVAETRLKSVLEEVAAYQDAQTNGTRDQPESEAEDLAKENDGASVRTMSITNSIRFSMANSIAKPIGNSLADELGFDTTEDESDYGGRESVLSNGGRGHMRNMSRDSVLSRTHMRHQSNDSLMRSGSAARGRLMYNHATLERLEDEIIKEDDETRPTPPKVEYTDSAVQYSPPPSPKVAPPKPATPEPSPFLQRFDRLYDVDSPPRIDVEIEANQRRKRVHIGQPLTIKPPVVGSLMVHGSSQTNADEPLSPPKTPKTPFQESPPSPQLPQPTTAPASTQTDLPPPLPHPFLSLPMPIPSISITPTSRPTTSSGPRLPQLTKDVGCQATLLGSVSTSEAAVQTEEILIDKRLAKLPLHLQPSSITSRPASPAVPVEDAATEDSRQFTPIPGHLPPRNPRRLTAKRSLTDLPSSPPVLSSSMFEDETHDAYPGNNDDGPLSSQRAPIRRPHRVSSLFAGFDANSSDEHDEFLEEDLSDPEYRTALSAPKPKVGSVRGGKRGGSTSTAASSDHIATYKLGGGKHVARPLDESVDYFGSATVYQTRDTRDTGFGRSGSKRGARSSVLGAKGNVMRRAAMIQSGIASHQRARSPSLTDIKEPPFPIPTRASSRKPPVSASAPSDGRASPTKGADSWHRRGGSRSHYRAGSVRRVRSAAAMPHNQRYRRHASRSPPPFSASTEAPESPGLPPLPANDITTPRNKDSYAYSKYKAHRSQPSTTTANTENTGAASSAGSHQTTSVVDSIAQTMVGEWMFKYVRRRKSFGVSDAKGGDDSSNDRHKRWVWLAPHERAILWSSKQPTSKSALMGKTGRKLSIQSVLDVKDDNPPPKNAGPVFNRSILILTPQRALKFTATSPERHYIWLTSLSFLAHSNQTIPENIVAQQPKPLPEQYEVPKARARRPGIRDSIRLTKAKTGAVRAEAAIVESSQADALPPSIPTHRRQLAEPFNLPVHARDLSRDAAEPPMIPRFHDRGREQMVHGRKRSNTGGHVPPPLSFRGFSSPISGTSNSYHAATNSTAGNSIGTAGSSDIYSNGGASSGMGGSSGMTWATGSVRTSEASSRPSGQPNFFDAIGTVRMEAFISPLAFGGGFDETPYEQQEDTRRSARRRSKEMRRRASRSRQRDSYSRGTRATNDTDDWYLRDDPFKGF
ncbi:anucleate primary sterigmata protein A [Rhypophila decipiens]|uniref:Anucleate primary sterigmata protein A n=1 Tax=Rhypophila decipiens TaxID=261697 RepID=A0AAN6YM24_9PEZI|nr:anucleate primary sterigmata protein A [Rhypophila decipiens]